MILSAGRVLQIAIPEITKSSFASPRTPRLVESVEREQILEALRESEGKVSRLNGAAARLGLRLTTLQSRMKKLRIERQYR